MCLRIVLAPAIVFAAILPLPAALQPAHMFQDHMVLQRDMPLPVWGHADAGAEVKVSFAGQQKSARADDKGAWKVVLDPLPASAEGRTLAISSGGESLALKDVLVGEVWLCSGQSNMARTLKNDAFEYPRFRDYANDADYPAIRFVPYTGHVSNAPLEDFDSVIQKEAKWQALDSKSAFAVMSLGFFFAKDLHRALNVPVGLVQVAVPGTPQTAWLSKETLDSVAAKCPGSPSYEKAFAKSEENLSKGKEAFKSWAEFETAEAAWKASPSGRPPSSNLVVADYPGVLYNAMIHPLAPLAFRGVLWHQGEGGPAANYRERLKAQVADWQKLFGHKFHFLWGSMTRNTSVPPPLGPEQQSHRGGIDEEFLLAAQDFGPNGDAALVGFFDLGNQSTHWGRKEEGGKRMAKAALATVYGQPETVYTGPQLVEAKIEGSTVRARLRHVGGGLVYEPSLDGISGFLIEEKGASQELRWADVKIEGDTVILSHPEVTKPTNVYYGWYSNPHETLFNKEGYPAFPFRAVPRVFGAKSAAVPPLVELMNAPERASLNVSHVRRDGYLFNAVQGKGSGMVTVRAGLPTEWKAAKVISQGKAVETGEMKTEADGRRYYEFSVELNGSDIAVVNAERPADFSGVERF